MRFRCEIDKFTLQRQMTRVLKMHDYTRSDIGRAAIPRLKECIDHDPGDFEAVYLLGTAAEIAGQQELALANYQKALDLNERPEIYASLGVLQLQMGQYEEAMQNLRQAILFNSYFAMSISSPLREEMLNAALARKELLTERAKQRGR